MPPGQPLRPHQIVAAARDLVRAGGVGGLSMRRLADRLDVSPAALYAHFATKHELLRAVAEVELERLEARVEAAMAGAGGVDALRRWARAQVEHAAAEPELFALLDLASRRIGPPVDEVAAVTTDDPATAALALWTAVRGVATAIGIGVDPASIDRIVDRLLPATPERDGTGGT